MNGLIQVYCGEGKGKTTAAVGASIRCAGGGGKVLFFQFLKDNTSSERNILAEIKSIDLLEGYYSSKFVWEMSDNEKSLAARFYCEKFNEIVKRVKENKYDMLVLDEIFDAVHCGFVPVELLLNFIADRPGCTEIIMTGRKPPRQIAEAADYITYMQKIRHPFDNGITARKMIEY